MYTISNKLDILIPVHKNSKRFKNILTALQKLENINIFFLLNAIDNKYIEKSIKNKLPNAIINYEKPNKNIWFYRNKLLKLVISDYFMFIDADDEIFVENIQMALCNINNSNDIFYFNLISEDREVLNFPELPYRCNMPQSVRYPKTILDAKVIFPENITFAEDVIFNKLLYEKNFSVRNIFYPLWIYKNNKNSLTNSKKPINEIDNQIKTVLELWMKIYYYKDWLDCNNIEDWAALVISISDLSQIEWIWKKNIFIIINNG